MRIIHVVDANGVEAGQGSDLWWEHKCGIPSASNFHRIITPVGMEISKSADKYIAELISELACQGPPYFTQKGKPVNNYAIQNGVDQEPRARRWYEMACDLDVKQVRCVTTDDGRFLCSPDGIIFGTNGPEGGLELKAPLGKTHAKYVMDGVVPRIYKVQVHGGLIVTRLRWWEFCSYSESLEPLRLRIEPDDFTDELAVALELFDDRYKEARERFGLEEKYQSILEMNRKASETKKETTCPQE